MCPRGLSLFVCRYLYHTIGKLVLAIVEAPEDEHHGAGAGGATTKVIDRLVAKVSVCRAESPILSSYEQRFLADPLLSLALRRGHITLISR